MGFASRWPLGFGYLISCSRLLLYIVGAHFVRLQFASSFVTRLFSRSGDGDADGDRDGDEDGRDGDGDGKEDEDGAQEDESGDGVFKTYPRGSRCGPEATEICFKI